MNIPRRTDSASEPRFHNGGPEDGLSDGDVQDRRRVAGRTFWRRPLSHGLHKDQIGCIQLMRQDPVLLPGPCFLPLPLTLSKSYWSANAAEASPSSRLPEVRDARHAPQPRCSPRGHYSSGRSGKVSFPSMPPCFPRAHMRAPGLTRHLPRATHRPVRPDTQPIASRCSPLRRCRRSLYIRDH